MATKIMKYTDDLGEIWGVTIDDTIINDLTHDGSVFDNGAGTYAQTLFKYNDFAAFEAANSGKQMLPATINARTFNLQHAFGTRTLISPEPFDLARLQSLQADASFGDGTLSITSLAGETRQQAIPEEEP